MMFVNLLNTIKQLFLRIIIEVQNLLILFILMYGGPSSIPNISGAKRFVSFIDDCTRVTWIFLMKDKSEVFHLFVNFYKMVQTQFETPIERLRSDNGR